MSAPAVARGLTTPTPLFSNGDTPQDKRTDFSDKCTARLYEALSCRGKILRKPNLQKWSASLRNLIDDLKEKGELDRFKEVFDWYLENIGNDHVPEAYSADSFISKFVRIESAMHRSQRASRTADATGDEDEVEFVNRVAAKIKAKKEKEAEEERQRELRREQRAAEEEAESKRRREIRRMEREVEYV